MAISSILCPDTVTEGDATRAEKDNMNIWGLVDKNVEASYMNIFRIFVEEYIGKKFSVRIFN